MNETDVTRRVPYGVWIEENEGSVPAFYLAHSLSPLGLRLLAKQPPRAPGPLRLQLLVENERRVMSLCGEVVACDTGHDEPRSFAVRFIRLDAEERAFLDDLFRESLQS